jgi:alkylhydroperoxidase family enzyme
MSVRRSVGRPADAPDLMDVARDYEQRPVSERQKVALRFVDAFLADPRGFDETSRAELERHLSTQEILELLFRVLANSANKCRTAIGIDAPLDADHLTAFSYSERGEAVMHGPIER